MESLNRKYIDRTVFPRPPLLIFDVDNTLIHQHKSGIYFTNVLRETLNHFSIFLPETENLNQLWGAGKNYPEILKKWGVQEIPKFWREFDRRDYQYRSQKAKNGELYLDENAVRVLSRLYMMDFVLVAYSNSNAPLANFLLSYFQIDKFFTRIRGLSPDKLPHECKPEIGGLNELIADLGYNPSLDSISIIGDSVTDIQAALRLGCQGLLYVAKKEYNILDIYPDLKPELNRRFKVINSLLEVFEIQPLKSDFGYWDSDSEGLPIYHYEADQYTLPSAKTFTTYGYSIDHFHQIGNSEWMATVHNDGRVQLMNNGYGFLWLTAFNPRYPQKNAGICSILDADSHHRILSDHIDKQILNTSNVNVKRIFGTYYFRKILENDSILLDHQISMPPIPIPAVESKIFIKNLLSENKSYIIQDSWPVNAEFIAKSSIVMLGNRKRFGKPAFLNIMGNLIKYIQKILKMDTISERNKWKSKVKYCLTKNISIAISGRTLNNISEIELSYKPGKVPKNSDSTTPQPFPPVLKSLFIIPITQDANFADPPSQKRAKSKNQNFDFNTQYKVDLGANESYQLKTLIIYCERKELDSILNRYLSITHENWGRLWNAKYLKVDIPGRGWLLRESIWHSAYTIGSIFKEQYFGFHKIPQGSIYAFGHGFDGSIRDYSFYLPGLVHLDKHLSREFLLYIFSLMREDGSLLYGTFGYSLRIPFVHSKASDLYLFLLWAFTEYLYLTHDYSILSYEIPYYPEPPTSSRKHGTILQRIEKIFDYLLSDAVGIGIHGAIKINDGDWSDGITFLARNRTKFMKEGESIFNTTLALYVIPSLMPFLNQYLPRIALKMKELLPTLENSVENAWNGRWFYRAYDGKRPPIGDKELFLEHHVWLLLANCLQDNKNRILIENIKENLENPMPFGQNLLHPPLKSVLNIFPKGWDVNGGIWYCINFLLSMGYSQRDPMHAIESLYRNSVSNRLRTHPHIWYGQWTGPDSFNAHYAERPGEAFYHPPTAMCDFPALNNNLHAGFLTCVSYIFGFRASPDSLILDLNNKPFYNFSTPQYSVSYMKGGLELHIKKEYISENFKISIKKPDCISKFNLSTPKNENIEIELTENLLLLTLKHDLKKDVNLKFEFF